MAHIPIPREPIPDPDVNRERLVECLTAGGAALRLKGLLPDGAVFESVVYYRMTPQTRARYEVTATVPLASIPFEDGKITSYIYPSVAQAWATFRFEKYCDNSGMGRSWVE